MSGMTAEALLEGPRGRRLCLELLLHAAEGMSGGSSEERAVVSWAATRLDPAYGTPAMGFFGPGASLPHPNPSSADAAAALARIPLPEEYEASLLWTALAASVDAARYWQEPDGEDLLAAVPELRPQLRRAAERIARSEAVSWWDDPVDRRNQRLVIPDGHPPPSDEAAAAALDGWREQWPELQPDPDDPLRGDALAMVGGDWWSIPPFALRGTTREVPGWGPAGIRWIEDGFGWNRFEVLEASTAPGPVLELRGPEEWAALCRRHPIDLSASTHRRHWLDVTGEDRRWVLPDWSRVAEEYAGVHLTVLGYLRTATRLVELGDGRASVLAGWNPDATYWLRDGTRATGRATFWSRPDQTEDWTAESP